MEIFLHVQKLPFVRCRRSDSQVQKQLYVQNGTGYPHQILNEHGKRVHNAESVKSRKTILPLFRVDGHICLVSFAGSSGMTK